MKISLDKVPINLEEAVKLLKEGLEPIDLKVITKPKFDAGMVHHTVGMAVRNDWSLWEKDTPLVKWFKANYGVEHADDLSSIILDCLVRDVQGKRRRAKQLAKRYIAHWKKKGL